MRHIVSTMRDKGVILDAHERRPHSDICVHTREWEEAMSPVIVTLSKANPILDVKRRDRNDDNEPRDRSRDRQYPVPQGNTATLSAHSANSGARSSNDRKGSSASGTDTGGKRHKAEVGMKDMGETQPTSANAAAGPAPPAESVLNPKPKPRVPMCAIICVKCQVTAIDYLEYMSETGGTAGADELYTEVHL